MLQQGGTFCCARPSYSHAYHDWTLLRAASLLQKQGALC